MRLVLIAASLLALVSPVNADQTQPSGEFDAVPQDAVPADPAPATGDKPKISPEQLRKIMEVLAKLPHQSPADQSSAPSATPEAVPAGPPPPAGSTPDLAANCNAGLLSYEAGTPDIHIGQCSGFIDAVMQDMQERRAAGDRMGICITGHVTEMGVIKLFAGWAERHPEPIPALDGVHAALKEAYPCEK